MTPPAASLDDARLFGDEAQRSLRCAVDELSWLLSRGYATDAALKLVGDRYQLTERQRVGVRRSSCSDDARALRTRGRLATPLPPGTSVLVDGLNLLITLSTLRRGGLLLRGRDGVVRDLAASHRFDPEDAATLLLAHTALASIGAVKIHWLFDRPVSNSGRLAQRVLALGQSLGWEASVVNNPDQEMIAAKGPVVTSDALILDACPWVDVLTPLINAQAQAPWVLDLRCCGLVVPP